VTAQPVRATGQHHVLSGQTRFGFATVTVTEVAASLHSFTVDGVDLVQRYRHDAEPSRGAGIIMAPWPNRVENGRWLYDGKVQQLDITDTEFSNACHGLLRYAQYRLESRTDYEVTLSARIYPHPGYPFALDTSVRYRLTDDGLDVEHTFVNIGAQRAPVAVGSHGYFTIGGVKTTDLVLTLAAAQVYETDDRMIPTRAVGVSGPRDLRAGRVVGELELDDCYTGLTRENERYSAELRASDGRAVTIWGDHNFDHFVICTTKAFLNENGIFVDAIAIEPQTAAVNAFNNGIGVTWLEPSEAWRASWGVSAQL
jgi:aldose 1-epimerase